MEDALRSKATILARVLAAIIAHLDDVEVADIRAFIAAGEYGLATDTIFSAIDANDIPVEETVVAQLAAVEDLYNTFGDLDPEVAGHVLRPDLKPTPFRM